MVSTRSMTARTKARRSAIAVTLPHDIVIYIVGLVAASSSQPMVDLYSLQAICKAMYKASKERVVGMSVALEREKAMKWLDNEHYLAVVNHLAGVGNPDAYFIVSLVLVFVYQDMQRGLVCLDRAAVTGHKVAAYMLGLLFYTAGEAHDVGKHYINQFEGELVDDECETAKRTNQECRRSRRLAVDMDWEATWKKMARPQDQVLALPEDGHRCTSTGCGVMEGWGDYVVFYSDGYMIRHEYAKFFA